MSRGQTLMRTLAKRERVIETAVAYVVSREAGKAAGFEFLDLCEAVKVCKPERFANNADVRCVRCGHSRDKHTTCAPTDYMGCTECDCSEFDANAKPSRYPCVNGNCERAFGDEGCDYPGCKSDAEVKP